MLKRGVDPLASLLGALAAEGLLAGCGGQTATTAPVVVDVAPPVASSSQPSPALVVATSEVRHAAPEASVARIDADCCKGKNDCKALGGCKVAGRHECAGRNNCKALGGCRARECSPAGTRAPKACCKGTNECKGKGNCKTPANACKGLNQCKAQGGCKPATC